MRPLLTLALLALPLAAAPVPKGVKKDTVIFAWSNGPPPSLTLFTPDGEKLRDVTFGKNKDFHIEGVSPDGKRLVVKTWYKDPNGRNAMMPDYRQRLHVVPLADTDKPFPEAVIDGWEPQLCWSGDGKTAYTSAYLQCPWPGSSPKLDLDVAAAKIDVASGKRTDLKLPKDVGISALSPDGKTLLTYRRRPAGAGQSGLELVPALTPTDTLEPDEGADTEGLYDAWVAEKRWGRGVKDGEPIELPPPKASPERKPLKWPKEWGGKEPWVWTLSPTRDHLLTYWGEKIDPPADWPANTPCSVTRLAVMNLRDGAVRTFPAPAASTKAEVYRTFYTGIAWR